MSKYVGEGSIVSNIRNGGVTLENIEKRLLAMKQEIDKSKEKLSELKGKKEALQEELRTAHQLNSVKEAEAFLASAEAELAELTSAIIDGIKQIEAKYDV